MDKYEVVRRIEKFAPLDSQEKWDCSGWLVETKNKIINKIMLCLTVTEDILYQAKKENCDMIISHHPLFFVPFSFVGNIDIYCSHTNLDIADGGTTDVLINELNFPKNVIKTGKEGSFVRYVEFETTICDFIKNLQNISPNMRYTNPKNISKLTKIGFCAGSGSEFIIEAYNNGADAFVTGDLKFHTAIESPIAVFDIGHFESEIMVLKVFENLINNDAQVIYALEKSPFTTDNL